MRLAGMVAASGMDLPEPLAFLDMLRELEIGLVCITAGSPYYNPHIQRPALFPAVGRLPAAGRPAGRRGATDPRDR